MCLLTTVVAAEVINGANVSDVVFPASPEQLQNFSGDITETVQITIPAESLERLSDGDSEPGLLDNKKGSHSLR